MIRRSPADVDKAVMVALGKDSIPVRELMRRLGMEYSQAVIYRSLARLLARGLVIRGDKEISATPVRKIGHGPEPHVFWRLV